MFKFISYEISKGKYLSFHEGFECVVHFTVLHSYVILKLLFRNGEMFFFSKNKSCECIIGIVYLKKQIYKVSMHSPSEFLLKLSLHRSQ